MGFFDKLKGTEEEKPRKKEKEKEEKEPKKKSAKQLKAVEKTATIKIGSEKKEQPPAEGELAIDVYETDEDFVIQSTVAGVKPDDLDITIENDIVTIRGSRQRQAEEIDKKYYYQECYWGSFSRQVILPEEVDGSKADATIKNGILILKIPKVRKVQKRKITIKQSE